MTSTKLNILVTGAAGFIGSHTVELLLANGHRVTGVDNLRTGSLQNLRAISRNPSWKFCELDILDAKNFQKVVRTTTPEIVLHLASLVSVPQSIANPELIFDLDVRSTHIVIEAAHNVGVRRLIFASSAAVYGEAEFLPLDEDSPTQPLSPYGAAKLASEALVLGAGKTYNIEAICLRYFNVYGPRQRADSRYGGVVARTLAHIQNGNPPVIFGDGNQSRDFVHVYDIARANLLAIEAFKGREGVCNICTGNATSIRELVYRLGSIHKSKTEAVFMAPRPGDICHSVGNPSRAQSWYEFIPKVTLASGLSEHYHWFDAHEDVELKKARRAV